MKIWLLSKECLTTRRIYGQGCRLAQLQDRIFLIQGGTSTKGHIGLSGPAPTLGTAVTLTSSNTPVVTVPASVTLSSVTTGIAFPITTKKVTAKTTVTIKATLGSVSKTVTLTVTP